MLLSTFIFSGKNGTENYTWINQAMPWTKAQHYCREHYTDLASVRNPTDNQRILNLTSGLAAWIGLYRTRLWSDKQVSTYENWRPATYQQPDNGFYAELEYGKQHCTAVSFRDSGHWTDEDCLSTFPFICYNKFCTGSSCTLHQYHFVNENKTWTEAQRYCRENYTDLATIENTEEMNTLFNTVNGSYSGLAWIGLYDDEDSWRWSLDDDAFYQEGERDFRGWERQPDNYKGNEMCVSMWKDVGWFDKPCTDRKSFVCYNGKNNTYMMIYDEKTWEEAQSFCRVRYTDLASVRNQNELQKIMSIVTVYEVWIGLYRNRLWSDQSNSTFTYWRPESPEPTAEPDNGVNSFGQRGSQHCTAVDHLGQWTDENCFARFPFICYW
ncbi:macrophage mannose receptor 1-like [Tachysurus fulvidraco]|uniref:macrophage mannose receptor 1-like n=1 Tax=Tachysurus fulvidraco TaxID=1234273 RepID=UPI001FEFE8EB|nr:macrophage mannose receptor 1-like [Tachysurus fulvidraco]